MKHLRVSGLLAALAALFFAVACEQAAEINPEEQRNETTFTARAKTPTADAVDIVVTHDGAADLTWYGICSADLAAPVRNLIDAAVSKGVSEENLLTGNKQTVSLTDLNPETPYVYIVFGLTADGKVYGTPASEYFTTKAEIIIPPTIDPDEVVFAVKVVSVTATGAVVEVSHNGSEEMTWWAGLCDAEDGEEEAFVEDLAEALEADPSLLSSGTSKTFAVGEEALEEDTEYKVLAFGFGAFEEPAPEEETPQEGDGEEGQEGNAAPAAEEEDEAGEEPETVTVYKTYGTPAVEKFTTEALTHHLIGDWVVKYVGNSTDENGTFSAFRIAGITEPFSYDLVPVTYVDANFASIEDFIDWDIEWYREDSGLAPADITFEDDGVYYDDAPKPGEYYIVVFGVDGTFNGTGNYAFRKFTVYPEGGEGPAFAGYDDFLGKWYMGNAVLEVSVKEAGESYWLDIANSGAAYGKQLAEAIYDDGRFYLKEQKMGEWNNTNYGMCDDYISGVFRYGSSTYPMYPINNPVPFPILSVTKMGTGEMIVTPGSYDVSGLGEGKFIGIQTHWVIRAGEYAGMGNTYGSVNFADQWTRIPPGYVAAKYEEFLGEWSLGGTTTITITEKEAGKTYTVNGFSLDKVNGSIKEAEAIFDGGYFALVEQDLGTWMNTNPQLNAQCQDFLSGVFDYGGRSYRNYPVNGDPVPIFTVFKTKEGNFDLIGGSCAYGDFSSIATHWVVIEGDNEGAGNVYATLTMPEIFVRVGGGGGEGGEGGEGGDEPGETFTRNTKWDIQYPGRWVENTGEQNDYFLVTVLESNPTNAYFVDIWPASVVTGTLEEAMATYAASALASFKKTSGYKDHIYTADCEEAFSALDNGSYYAMVIGVKADETLSGLFAAAPFTVDVTEPAASDAYSKWLGDWTAPANIYDYNQSTETFYLASTENHTWTFEAEYNNASIRLWGLENKPRSWELDVLTKFDSSTGDLLLASQFIGEYEQDGDTYFDYLFGYVGQDDAKFDDVGNVIARLHMNDDGTVTLTGQKASDGDTFTGFKVNVADAGGDVYQYSGTWYEFPMTLTAASGGSGAPKAAPRWNAASVLRQMSSAFLGKADLQLPVRRSVNNFESMVSQPQTTLQPVPGKLNLERKATGASIVGENYMQIPTFQGKRGKSGDRW